ncbi:DUF445 family protein [Mesorhizobium sp. LHD-90]|uniref:DUF445 domain-containing protein n=1 Tax=Mesorhizobium sp. LHD-90 TaxID=3071414 RepID=UPI0027E11204|nr:DUF445 family protein [Mesorhizobium sp. LHD-90]MDQ6432920.1 DUF445 family protein [Mesorhizobium sp. LHD-90]
MANSEVLTATAESREAEKLAALKRTKLFATLALGLCLAVLVVARSFQARWPWLGFVAAFAEAATIGGLADWYAVVALFRRPLGLPIPHTAIIPENRVRIADNLGRFIEVNFLAPGPVKAKLEEVDFAALVADWLSDRRRAGDLAAFVARLAPQALTAIEQSGLKDFATRRLAEQVEKVPVAPLAAGLLQAVTAEGRHQKLLDELTGALAKTFSDETMLASMRDRIRSELPSLFNLFRADAYLLKKIVASAASFLKDVQDDPDHPLRREFDRFVENFVERLRTSEDYAERAEALKRDLLARPELRSLAGDLWGGVRAMIEQDLAAPRSAIRTHLAGMFVNVGRHLASDPDIRADMNKGFVVSLAAFVDSQKSGVSNFIAEQVKRWDLAQLTRVVELNIGRDLQYIRFNGMLIGGLAGLILYGAERLLWTN